MGNYLLGDLYFGKLKYIDWIKYSIIKTGKELESDIWLMDILQPRSIDEYNRFASVELTDKIVKDIEITINSFKMGRLFLTRAKFKFGEKKVDAPLLVDWCRDPISCVTHPILKFTMVDIDREHMIPLKDIVNLDEIDKLEPDMYATIIKKISTKAFAKKFNKYIEELDAKKEQISNAEKQVEIKKQQHAEHKNSFQKIEL